MSTAILSPSRLTGTVQAPPSKSAAHRALICAALSRGVCQVKNISASQDMQATLRAVRAMGIHAELEHDSVSLSPAQIQPDLPVTVDCGESGSTLRFFIPIFAALGIPAVFTGEGRLPERPIGIYLDLLPAHGVSCRTEGGLPLEISGRLEPGLFELPGNVSSQFITGLLFALPLLGGDSGIRLTTPLESAGYVEMTLAVLRDFGISVEQTADGWRVPGGQSYCAQDYEVEGDWSQAAFFLAAGALGGDLAISGLRPDSCQGDRAARDLFAQFGAQITEENGLLHVRPGDLHGIDIDASQIPDLVPILAATAALAQGHTSIHHAERLRIKESDRLAAMAAELTRLGARVRETPGGLEIDGVPSLRGGDVSGWNDHRVVMSLAIAALRAGGETRISDAQSVRKSYPDFFEVYQKLGGIAHVVSMG